MTTRPTHKFAVTFTNAAGEQMDKRLAWDEAAIKRTLSEIMEAITHFTAGDTIRVIEL